MSEPIEIKTGLEPVTERLRPVKEGDLWMDDKRWTAQTVGDLERIFPQVKDGKIIQPKVGGKGFK